MEEKQNISRNIIELTGEIRNDIQLFEKDSGKSAHFQIEYTAPVINSKKKNIFPCVAWNEMADDVCRRFKKGDKIFISGKLFSSNYIYPSGDISYGVQIWLDVCEPIEEFNKAVNYNADDFFSEQEISIGDDDEDELYNGKPMPF